MPAGVMSRIKLDDEARSDIERGVAVLHALAPMDVGQAVVVQQGIVLGIEAIEGTAGLVARVKDLHRDGGRRGVLVKISKPLQDASFDLPTIGPDTIEQAHSSGLCGVALEAGRALFLDPDKVIQLCDLYGLFLVGLKIDLDAMQIRWSESN